MKNGMLIYLGGAMESMPDRGLAWRRSFAKTLEYEFGARCIIPNDEEKKIKKRFNVKVLKRKDPHKYVQIMREFITVDLEFVKSADMVVVKWEGEFTAGTIHEVGYAHQLGKPTFLVTSKTMCEVPGWFFACFTKVFSSLEELVLHLKGCEKTIFVVDIDGTICNSIGRVQEMTTKYGDTNSWR